MIATGGLLRINARRQDSLRSKPHKPHTHRRRNKKKRKNEVVVVKGKLKLCSVSGLVAALGILVLVVGVVMAALGYWPREGLFFNAQPQEGAAMASVSSVSFTPEPAEAQEGEWEQERGDYEDDRDQGDEERGGRGDESYDWKVKGNGTMQKGPRGFLQDFLDRYLYSDRLKVFGPLIMGIGIFLFICANAVLHENRDKKTKVINLRDIYSTVIDLHSLHRPHTPSLANPLNGLVNYVQSKSLETKPKAYPASLMSRAEGGAETTWSRCPSPVSSSGGGDAVFTICQDLPSHRLSLPPRFSPPPPPLQMMAISSFTLPLCRPRPPAPPRRHSAWAGGVSAGGGKEVEDSDKVACTPPLCFSTSPQASPLEELPSVVSCSSPSLSQALMLLSCSSLTPSHLSLSSLSQLLSSSSPTPAPPCRRRSLPTGGIAGYSKLMSREDELFESIEMMSSCPVTSQERGERTGEAGSQRKFSNRGGLRKVSQVESG